MLTNEAGIAMSKATPGVCGGLKQRPVIPVRSMIRKTENLGWRSTDLRVGPAAGQDRLDLGTLMEPRLDCGRLRSVDGIDVDVRGQPPIEPTDECPAEGLHHGADADIDREREQERHQRQRQSRKLLAAVGPEPHGERAICASLAQEEYQ